MPFNRISIFGSTRHTAVIRLGKAFVGREIIKTIHDGLGHPLQTQVGGDVFLPHFGMSRIIAHGQISFDYGNTVEYTEKLCDILYEEERMDLIEFFHEPISWAAAEAAKFVDHNPGPSLEEWLWHGISWTMTSVCYEGGNDVE